MDNSNSLHFNQALSCKIWGSSSLTWVALLVPWDACLSYETMNTDSNNSILGLPRIGLLQNYNNSYFKNHRGYMVYSSKHIISHSGYAKAIYKAQSRRPREITKPVLIPDSVNMAAVAFQPEPGQVVEQSWL